MKTTTKRYAEIRFTESACGTEAIVVLWIGDSWDTIRARYSSPMSIGDDPIGAVFAQMMLSEYADRLPTGDSYHGVMQSTCVSRIMPMMQRAGITLTPLGSGYEMEIAAEWTVSGDDENEVTA